MPWLTWIWLACASDPCELALQRQEAAISACGGVLQRELWWGQECSAAEAELLSCEADCMEAADCRVLAEAPRAYSDVFSVPVSYSSCIQECPTPW